MIELNFFLGGCGGDLRQVPVGQVDAAVGELADGSVVRDHQNGVAFAMKLAQQADDGLLIGFVEIAGRLVGQNQFRMIDERASHGYALLFAAGKLRGQVLDAIGKTDAGQRGAGFVFVGGAMEILREHHVFNRREIGHEVKLLEDESDFLGAEAGESFFVEPRDVDAVD